MLLRDRPTILFYPLPHPLEELLPSQVVPGYALLSKHLLYYYLGSDPRVIDTGKPQGWVAHHAVPANHNVFQGCREGVTQMKLAGDIGRGHDYHKGLLL